MASSYASALKARSIHIKVYPTPHTFSARRSVLNFLQTYGEVTMFRPLKYNTKDPIPNAFLSVYSSEAAARSLIEASPAQYRMVIEKPVAGEEGKVVEEDKLYELHVHPTPFDHTTYISNAGTNPLYGPWKPSTPSKMSLASASLSLNIPPSIMAAGLKDWDIDSERWRTDQSKAARKRAPLPRVMQGLKDLKGEEESKAKSSPRISHTLNDSKDGIF